MLAESEEKLGDHQTRLTAESSIGGPVEWYEVQHTAVVVDENVQHLVWRSNEMILGKEEQTSQLTSLQKHQGQALRTDPTTGWEANGPRRHVIHVLRCSLMFPQREEVLDLLSKEGGVVPSGVNRNRTFVAETSEQSDDAGGLGTLRTDRIENARVVDHHTHSLGEETSGLSVPPLIICDGQRLNMNTGVDHFDLVLFSQSLDTVVEQRVDVVLDPLDLLPIYTLQLGLEGALLFHGELEPSAGELLKLSSSSMPLAASNCVFSSRVIRRSSSSPNSPPISVGSPTTITSCGESETQAERSIYWFSWRLERQVLRQSLGLRLYVLCLDISSCMGSRITHSWRRGHKDRNQV
ncbi:hypothetical protein EYF80_018604 [Liparis tanakae]|uniref:Uncharacterized protein n=1 Tax=Liparis tanakae TaxID=230148 RepID=A0A4Z2HZQ0_9TELE|nr:hypothetical protein EYF80_018604 [Liparis tanakae]